MQCGNDTDADFEAFMHNVHGVLAEEKNRKILLERKIIGSQFEGALGGNEVVSKDDDVEHVWPSAEVDMSDDDVE
ncbi:hypothetical protein AXG93_194s1040 [Marchantia polymorpha subsp. ruderalis]|uniref:Uncharacterized protein n=1 Tax=Marchantia polymorpha subsp. ruderalis TaxID=1480154 RepID=A0A176VID8_MARPO|nr:hypothetical protein AXG93_194s1040 [Marchantia polymorpha subsp. ruderalis]